MKASRAAREKVLRIAAHMLEADPEDLEAEDGEVFVRGSRSQFVTMADVGRAAYIRAIELPEGEDPGIEAVEAFDPPQFAWPYGANIAVVEVDVETGEVSFLDFLYVHDCGTIINPTIVEGQLQGGVAQGIGAALFESLPYDDEGQPLVATFMEYVLPTAAEVPRLTMEHQHTPSPHIPGGMKGVGEAGAIGSPSAVVAAIEDALAPFDVRITATPVTPAAIVELVTQADLASA